MGLTDCLLLDLRQSDILLTHFFCYGGRGDSMTSSVMRLLQGVVYTVSEGVCVCVWGGAWYACMVVLL